MLAMQKLTEPTDDDNTVRPACPSCGRALQLSRITPGSKGVPDLRTYACRDCGLWLTEADDRR
jgi:transposase-like protein